MNPRYFLGIILFCGAVRISAAQPFLELSATYQQRIKPLIKSYCLKCHSTKKEEGELDMERISTLAEVRKNPKVWLKVREMMGNGEMPPEKKPQLAAKEAQVFAQWLDAYLDAEARANAGDPGRVVLRRLSNAEYTY
ncbi:MAG: c-type cytochrome domain-containing protein, partial [Verrucomicrobiota bacterium]|nr:c-type cytochrome domain-containing protein [Verrucomicrobiota bacterium]